MSAKARVLVADSSRIHTQLLSEILGRDPNLEVIGWDFEASTIVTAAVSHNVDILALGSELNGSSKEAVAAVREMRAAQPSTKIVVLLESHSEEAVLDFLRVGANGIFEKEGSLEMLRQCLHAVNRGEIWLDNRFVALLINFLAAVPTVPDIKAKGKDSLTKREREVLQLLVQGLSNREISERMSLSEHTVKNYILHIFDKMGVSSRAELLYLILSQDKADNDEISRKALRGGRVDDRTFSMLSQEAEKGSPTAQLSLAQAYAVRPDRPGNFSNAYKWYRIVSERIAQAHSVLATTMSPRDLEETEREARKWLSRRRPTPAVVGNSHKLEATATHR